jgi:hypothetical protein
MGFRSYFFVRRLVIARNYGSALMSQHRFTVTKIVFRSAACSQLSPATPVVACSGLF